MIEFAVGDLLDHQVFAHGCNTLGIMGRGVALDVRLKYPHAYQIYRSACSRGSFTLGSSLMVRCGDSIVFHLGTQPRPGRCAKPKAIQQALDAAITECLALNIEQLAIPWIGCGLGGLVHTTMQPIFERCGTRIPRLLVVSRP